MAPAVAITSVGTHFEATSLEGTLQWTAAVPHGRFFDVERVIIGLSFNRRVEQEVRRKQGRVPGCEVQGSSVEDI